MEVQEGASRVYGMASGTRRMIVVVVGAFVLAVACAPVAVARGSAGNGFARPAKLTQAERDEFDSVNGDRVAAHVGLVSSSAVLQAIALVIIVPPSTHLWGVTGVAWAMTAGLAGSATWMLYRIVKMSS